MAIGDHFAIPNCRAFDRAPRIGSPGCRRPWSHRRASAADRRGHGADDPARCGCPRAPARPRRGRRGSGRCRSAPAGPARPGRRPPGPARVSSPVSSRDIGTDASTAAGAAECRPEGPPAAVGRGAEHRRARAGGHQPRRGRRPAGPAVTWGVSMPISRVGTGAVGAWRRRRRRPAGCRGRRRPGGRRRTPAQVQRAGRRRRGPPPGGPPGSRAPRRGCRRRRPRRSPAACSGVHGGVSRVLLRPGTGALVITSSWVSAHRASTARMSRTVRTVPSTVPVTFDRLPSVRGRVGDVDLAHPPAGVGRRG